MRRLLCFLLSLLFLLLPAAAMAAPQAAEEITILFTHDLHSNFFSFTRMDGDTPHNVGGYARLKTMLDQEREGVDALIVDAGDFSMGTLFQTIYASHASELRLMGKLNYDAVTLGNHEFDFGTQGLTDMLHSAAQSGDKLPQLLFHAGELSYEEVEHPVTLLDDLSDAFYKTGTQQTVVLEKNGTKIGLFSVFGKESADFSPTMEITPPDIIKNAKAAVKELQAQGAELIVCLSHAGTNENAKKSEDEQLAAAVPAIDVIISGHSHTYLHEPMVKGDTYIASCGENGQYLGKMVLKKSEGRWALKEYALLPIDESIAADLAIEQEIEKYKSTVEQYYLSRFGGMKFDGKIGRADFSSLRFDVYEHHGESLLGNFIADAYRKAAEQEDKPVACAIVPAGTIRWGIPQGTLTLADVFNVSSLGFGPDGFSGYPLLDVYLTGKELRNAAEVDASITALMPDAQLYFSGMHVTFHPRRLPLNKVMDVYLTDENDEPIELNDDELYRVVCGLYSAQMLSHVKEKSFGILSIVPKDEEGNKITDFEARILRDANGTEIKEWYAIASFIQSFQAGDDGLPAIPAYYNQPHDRKVVSDAGGSGIYLSNLNGFSRILFGILFLLVLAIVFVIYRLATRKKRRWRRRNRIR